MEFILTDMEDLIRIQPKVFGDQRGFFLESYVSETFRNAGITTVFTQDNHSFSKDKGVLRGLHFQKPPFTQSKLIRVTQGTVYDVVVDLRKASSTFGQWRGFELSAENFSMLFVPAGFAHGFCTLSENTHVQYKVDAPYAPEHDSGIIWKDPALSIEWPVARPILSDKDMNLDAFHPDSTYF
jgi:dTDP-4-dehydrorhamnose 3,5-epimerase